MSGLRDGRFALTATRAAHWHKGQVCPCSTLEEIAVEHLEPSGFRWVRGNGGRWLLVEGPGLPEGKTGALYSAVSGLAGFPEFR